MRVKIDAEATKETTGVILTNALRKNTLNEIKSTKKTRQGQGRLSKPKGDRK